MKTVRGGVEGIPEDSIIKQQSEELQKLSCCVFIVCFCVSGQWDTRSVARNANSGGWEKLNITLFVFGGWIMHLPVEKKPQGNDGNSPFQQPKLRLPTCTFSQLFFYISMDLGIRSRVVTELRTVCFLYSCSNWWISDVWERPFLLISTRRTHASKKGKEKVETSSFSTLQISK